MASPALHLVQPSRLEQLRQELAEAEADVTGLLRKLRHHGRNVRSYRVHLKQACVPTHVPQRAALDEATLLSMAERERTDVRVLLDEAKAKVRRLRVEVLYAEHAEYERANGWAGVRP